MTLEQFILKVIVHHTIEFATIDEYAVGYKFTVSRLTKDDRLYRVQMSITHEALDDMTRSGAMPWEHIYKNIVLMMSEAMMKPYPDDPQQKPRQLVRYVTDFVRKHEISCGEDIHQSDEMNLMAPEFMDKCCELIGYYEEH